MFASSGGSTMCTTVIVLRTDISLSEGLAVTLLGVLFIDKIAIVICQHKSKLTSFTTCPTMNCQVF